MKIGPSILAGDLSAIGAELAAMESAGVDSVHWDVMDGHFVPNLTFGAAVIRACRSACALSFDVHLMTADPRSHIEALGEGLAAQVSIQVETTHFAPRLLQAIRSGGARAGIVLNPQTPLSSAEDVYELADNVLLMSVDPGFAGQSFLAPVYAKIERLAQLREQRGLSFKIQVDGGVNAGNLARLAGLGVDDVVCGAAYFNAPDRAAFARQVQQAGRA